MEKQIFLWCEKCNLRARVTRGQWITYKRGTQLILKRMEAEKFGLDVQVSICPQCEQSDATYHDRKEGACA